MILPRRRKALRARNKRAMARTVAKARQRRRDESPASHTVPEKLGSHEFLCGVRTDRKNASSPFIIYYQRSSQSWQHSIGNCVARDSAKSKIPVRLRFSPRTRQGYSYSLPELPVLGRVAVRVLRLPAPGVGAHVV